MSLLLLNVTLRGVSNKPCLLSLFFIKVGLMKLKIEFAKNKCLSTFRSTETIPILELIQLESIIKRLILCDFTNNPPLGLWPFL